MKGRSCSTDKYSALTANNTTTQHDDTIAASINTHSRQRRRAGTRRWTDCAADRSHGLNSPATTKPDTMPAANMLLCLAFAGGGGGGGEGDDEEEGAEWTGGDDDRLDEGDDVGDEEEEEEEAGE